MPPFRWDLVTPDQLGSLLDGTGEPDLWFRDELWRWHQHADWAARLPARSVVNVSLPWPVWSYFGNTQVDQVVPAR